jgi:hypothetical protein
MLVEFVDLMAAVITGGDNYFGAGLENPVSLGFGRFDACFTPFRHSY